MQIPANNKWPCVEILAVSFCQSRKKARVFWKLTLPDVVHLRHDGGNDAKDFGSVPNLDGLEMSRHMRWEKHILRGQNGKNLPDSTLWHPPLFPPTSRRWKSRTHQLWKLDVKILDTIRAVMVIAMMVMMKWIRKEEAEVVDNLLKNRDVEKIAFQAHSMIHLNIYGLLIANHIIGIIKTSLDYRWLW